METETPEIERLRAILKNMETKYKEFGKTLQVFKEALGEKEPDPFWRGVMVKEEPVKKPALVEPECKE